MKRPLILLTLVAILFSGCSNIETNKMFCAKTKVAMDRLCVNDGGVFTYEFVNTYDYRVKVSCSNGKTFYLSDENIENTYGEDVIEKLNKLKD